MKKVAIIGGGPAGLMAAEILSRTDVQVDLYEAKQSVGRKFLVAGKGGLNLTHAEPFESFLTRFGRQPNQIASLLKSFTPTDVRQWSHELGIETFVGPSGRVFPKDMKATPMLQRWTKRLRGHNVRFHPCHRWLGWDNDHGLLFQTPTEPLTIRPDATILAMGGASWPKLGSDGTWVPLLQNRGIKVTKLEPANSGFNVNWSDHFRKRFAGEPIKSVILTFTNSAGNTFQRQGSCVVTEYGLEGSLIYAASSAIRDELLQNGTAMITLDLAPDRTKQQLIKRLSIPRGSRTISNHLKSKVNISGIQSGLLREFAADSLSDTIHLANAIKRLSIPLDSARPVAEAISTAGGVSFDQLDDVLMVKAVPGLFCAGEMLNWEAPTGGYLLTACFATGRVAGQGALQWVLN